MRRNRPKVVWLPNTNANSIGPVDPIHTGQRFNLDFIGPGVAGDFVAGEIPIVIDGEQAPLDTATSLSDIFNSAYRIRRIVGKIFVGFIADEAAVSQIYVTAGLIVRRAEELGTSLAFASDSTGRQIAPGLIQNSSDPWIWRRNWLLRNNLSGVPAFTFPNATSVNFATGGGSVADGPHVDVKTARIVSQEERLFLNVQMTLLQEQVGQDTTSLAVLADLRVLATIKTSTGNRRNASR